LGNLSLITYEGRSMKVITICMMVLVVVFMLAITASPAVAQECDPNYSGCVPIASDVDCAGGSGNGPAYVQGPVTVIGSDIYGLDSDGDGIACEAGGSVQSDAYGVMPATGLPFLFPVAGLVAAGAGALFLRRRG